jgi:Ca-activated chloride channel family protein
MSPSPSPSEHVHGANGSGAILVATDGRTLPLRSTAMRVRAGGGLAAVVLTQRFTNPHAEPLAVTYQVPLPADGAVSGYRFRIGDREIRGEVARRSDARERFVQAVLDGRTAALLEQDRTSVFTQEIGNLPPGATIDLELQIDQPLVWTSEQGGTWEWRFPTVVAPRYLGAPGRVADADRVTTRTTLDPLAVTAALELTIDDVQHGIECPSHGVRIHGGDAGGDARTRVELAEANATLDRDVVVRWRVAGAHAATVVHRARPAQGHPMAADAFALLTIVPPAAATNQPHVARDLIVLLDTSGSMSGAPLDQARRLTCALVDQLDERDRLELIEFSTAARAWQAGPVAATAAQRTAAKQWVGSLHAGGGTEMRTGIRAALAALRPEAQRQIVLVTDGQIGFESEIVAEIHGALPAGCRVHTVGVGSAVNRSLTAPAARAGRGCEIVIGIDEDPERAIAKLCIHTHAPLVVDVALDGDALLEHAPMHLPDLMAGHPATIAVRVRPEGGALRVRGRTASGAWEQRLQLPATGAADGNPAIVTRFGRERVEDLELRIAAGERGLDPQIEQTGLSFGIATRLTSWIAVDGVVSVDPGAPTRHEVMPHALPHGMSATGVGLRKASGGTMELLAEVSLGAASADGSAREEAKAKKMESPIVARSVRRAAPVPSAPPRPASASAPSGPPPRARATDDDEGASADRGAHGESERLTQAGTASAVLDVHADVTRLADGTLVLEFTIPADAPGGGIDWTLPPTIELRFDDGTLVTVAIDPTRSTRGARLLPGMRAKLVCPGAPQGTLTLAVATSGLLLLLRP